MWLYKVPSSPLHLSESKSVGQPHGLSRLVNKHIMGICYFHWCEINCLFVVGLNHALFKLGYPHHFLGQWSALQIKKSKTFLLLFNRSVSYTWQHRGVILIHNKSMSDGSEWKLGSQLLKKTETSTCFMIISKKCVNYLIS